MKPRVLVGCECSGRVRDAFAKLGFDAWSCDINPSETLGQHIQEDVLAHLDDGWDLGIFHPPCTFLCRHRSRWETREDVTPQRQKAREFFLTLLNASIPKICIENPVPLKTANLPHYSQIIQPWQFGHDYSKKTCMWLKNLPKLKPSEIVELTYYITPNGKKFTKGWYMTPRNMIARSRTFQGIANAMADQWGKYLMQAVLESK